MVKMESQRLLESQAHLAGRDYQVVQALMVKMEYLGLMVRLGHPDLQAHLATMVPMENLVLLATRVLKENLVRMGKMVRTESRGLQALRVKLELQVLQDLQAQQVLMELTRTATPRSSICSLTWKSVWMRLRLQSWSFLGEDKKETTSQSLQMRKK
jgi:hypothetical protein